MINYTLEAAVPDYLEAIWIRPLRAVEERPSVWQPRALPGYGSHLYLIFLFGVLKARLMIKHKHSNKVRSPCVTNSLLTRAFKIGVKLGVL